MKKEMELKDKICFNDLSTSLKVSIVFSYILIVIYAIAFLVGVIGATFGVD